MGSMNHRAAAEAAAVAAVLFLLSGFGQMPEAAKAMLEHLNCQTGENNSQNYWFVLTDIDVIFL